MNWKKTCSRWCYNNWQAFSSLFQWRSIQGGVIILSIIADFLRFTTRGTKMYEVFFNNLWMLQWFNWCSLLPPLVVKWPVRLIIIFPEDYFSSSTSLKIPWNVTQVHNAFPSALSLAMKLLLLCIIFSSWNTVGTKPFLFIFEKCIQITTKQEEED